MGLQEAVKTCLSKYADFNGRARRSEYWFWALAVGLAIFAIEILALIFLAVAKPLGILLFVVLVVVALGAIVPGIAVTVRRLHDTGKPGVYILFGLIPLVGGIIMLVFTVSDSVPGDNQYGPNPKGIGGGAPGMGYGQPPAGYGQPPAR